MYFGVVSEIDVDPFTSVRRVLDDYSSLSLHDNDTRERERKHAVLGRS